jgi:hypothetical protein
MAPQSSQLTPRGSSIHEAIIDDDTLGLAGVRANHKPEIEAGTEISLADSLVPRSSGRTVPHISDENRGRMELMGNRPRVR